MSSEILSNILTKIQSIRTIGYNTFPLTTVTLTSPYPVDIYYIGDGNRSRSISCDSGETITFSVIKMSTMSLSFTDYPNQAYSASGTGFTYTTFDLADGQVDTITILDVDTATINLA